MRDSLETLIGWKTDEARHRSSYRRLVASRLPVNIYSAQAPAQRSAAALLHGLDEQSGLWEELDGCHLADDDRGDRTSLFLGGATGGVVATAEQCRGLIAAAGMGTLLLTNIEKLPPAAQRVLCRMVEAGRYTPVGDPYPRPIGCRIIVATYQPLAALARNFQVIESLASALGHITLCAEQVIGVLTAKDSYKTHPGTFAVAI